jgi:hypothetical protein
VRAWLGAPMIEDACIRFLIGLRTTEPAAASET